MNEFYNFYHYYYGENISETINLREACKEADTLTLNFTKMSGFNEIDDKSSTINVVNENMIVGETFEEMASDLIIIIKRVLKENWNSQQRHCILMSAGRNSRIIMMCLQYLQQEGLDLGDYEIVTHQHEHIYARDICNELGFPLERLHIWREETVNRPDHYRFAELDCQPNACRGPVLYPFEKDYDYSNNVLVAFGMAGAIFLYPYNRNWNNLSMEILNRKQNEGFIFADQFNQWRWEGRILNPFIHFDLLGYMCSIPNCIYNKKYTDIIRNTILQQLGGTQVPLIYGHKYNTQFSQMTKNRIKNFYNTSKFYNKFKFKAQPELHFNNNHNTDMKALGLALMYEGV